MELLAIMARARCLRLKTADVELELSPLAFALPDEKQPERPIGLENGGEPTEEQMLMWSAGGQLPPATSVPNG